MNKLLPLLKVQFLSLFGINKTANKKKGKAVGVAGIFGIAILFVAMISAVAYIYAKMFAETYLVLGKAQEFLTSIFALINVICLIFSFYTSSSNLYGGKDFDLLNAMPIKTHIIVLSKLVFMYLADLIFAVLILIPSVIVQFDMLGGVATTNLIRLGIMALLLPVFPMVVSIILGALIALISTNFKRKTLVQSLLYGFVFLTVYGLSLINTDLMDTLAPIRKMYLLFPLVEKGMLSFEHTALFCGISAVIFALAVFVVCKTYNWLNTKLKSVKRTKNFTLGTYGQNSQLKVLLKKEFKLLFSAPIYAMNTLLGSVFVLIGGIAFTVMSFNAGLTEVAVTFAIIMQALFAFALMISPTTAVSISVEGSTFYLMRTMPISTKRLLNVKLLVNLLVGAIPALISSLVFAFSLKGASIWFILLGILNSVLYSVLGGNLGLLFNLLFPMMKWDNITKAVKQSFSVFFTVLVGMLMAGGVFCLLFFVELKIELLFLIIFAVLASFCALTYYLIMKNGEKLIIKKT
ncbi:MAG: hypothetical protein J6V71_02705 [Clostridia bacterium]|nr:hypothetical protein [Clostridia bacterium]